MKKSKEAGGKFAETAKILKSLGHGARLAILEELLGGARCVSDLQNTLSISQPNLSQHLNVMRRAGLIGSLPSGPMRCYYIEKPALARGLLGVFEKDHGGISKDKSALVQEALRARPVAGKSDKPAARKSRPKGRAKRA